MAMTHNHNESLLAAKRSFIATNRDESMLAGTRKAG